MLFLSLMSLCSSKRDKGHGESVGHGDGAAEHSVSLPASFPPSRAGSRGLQTAKGGVGRCRTPALGVEEGLDGIADLRLSMLAQCDAAKCQRFSSL